tara:strand:- start:124 stop:300 length:177 start_codon:yes stop_codon:yes gene_type:complete
MSIDSQMKKEEQSIDDRYTFGDISEDEYRQELRRMQQEFKILVEEDAQDEQRNEQHYN